MTNDNLQHSDKTSKPEEATKMAPAANQPVVQSEKKPAESAPPGKS